MNAARDRVLSARWAIFDLDGTLFSIPVDWKPLRERMIEMCREEGAGEEIKRIRDAYEFASDRPALKAHLLALHGQYEERGRAVSVEVRAGSELAQARLSKGLPSAVLTMNTRQTADHLLGTWGFALIVTIEDVRMPKPHPEGIEIILGKLGADRRMTVMLGNSDYDRGASEGADIAYVDVSEL